MTTELTKMRGTAIEVGSLRSLQLFEHAVCFNQGTNKKSKSNVDRGGLRRQRNPAQVREVKQINRMQGEDERDWKLNESVFHRGEQTQDSNIHVQSCAPIQRRSVRTAVVRLTILNLRDSGSWPYAAFPTASEAQPTAAGRIQNRRIKAMPRP